MNKYLVSGILFGACYLVLGSSTAQAVVDPLSTSNNKFGIHIISPVKEEVSQAAQLVNTNGDWGYVTFIIEAGDRNKDKWQEFFNELRRKHLIPIVRITTRPSGDNWEKPVDKDPSVWADFLDSLNWPTKNRYVVVYNEPNHGREWGGSADPASYAKALDQTINSLKTKSDDFFILNAGLDASSPQQPPAYYDEASFLEEMNQAVPGIFNKLDGWSSHSYPKDFVGSPTGFGRASVRTYLWEKQTLKSLGLTKDLPVFITETGWQHAEGVAQNRSLPTADTVASYYKAAFTGVWNDPNVVAVTPFVLDYQSAPFDHFSFKKLTSQISKIVLGVSFPDHYPSYQVLAELPKQKGQPKQINSAQYVKGQIYQAGVRSSLGTQSSLVSGESYNISLTFKNTGQSIWNDSKPVKLIATQGGKDLKIPAASIPFGQQVQPGEEYTFDTKIESPKSGNYQVKLNLVSGDQNFDSNPIDLNLEVKSPVVLLIRSALGWKSNYAGNYGLTVVGSAGESNINVSLDQNGESTEQEARYLLPGYTFEFTLSKPFYKSKTIYQTVQSGTNTLDFGTLSPDIGLALLNPAELWKLMPFSQ